MKVMTREHTFDNFYLAPGMINYACVYIHSFPSINQTIFFDNMTSINIGDSFDLYNCEKKKNFIIP